MTNRTQTGGSGGAGQTLVTLALAVTGAAMLVAGVWGFLDARSFADVVAPYAAYGEHFLHDAGAFQVGIGVSALLALTWRDSAMVILAGAAVADALHFVSHVWDRDWLGAGFILLLGVLAVAGLVARARFLAARGGPARSSGRAVRTGSGRSM